MIKKNKHIIIFVLLISIIFFSCQYKRKESYYVQTFEYDSSIIYNNNINIYRIFANHTLSKEFTPIIEDFYFDIEYYNKEVNKKYDIKIVHSIDELKNIVLGTINIEQYISKSFFDKNKLGLIIVPFKGLNYLKNEKLYMKDNYLTFSIELWDQKSNACPTLANMAMYFISIPK